MGKSRRGRSGPIPASHFGGARRAPSLDDLLPRAKPTIDLEAMLTKEPVGNENLGAPAVSPSAATSPQVSPAKARKAERCARDGAHLTSQGRPAQAVPLLLRSIELNPMAAMSHHDLGVALMATGRLDQAAEALTTAFRLDPTLATALNHLANIFDWMGQEDRALASYQAAVGLKPDLVAAQIRLGELYQSRRFKVESAAAFRAAAAAAPGTLTSRIAEARALEVSGAFDEALAAMRALLEAHPEAAEVHVRLAKLLAEAGHSADAALHYERATELSPETTLGWFGLATNRKFTVDDGPLVARMSATLARNNLTLRDRRRLHFALGKAHDDMANYEAAMQNFEAGNRLRALSGGLRRDVLERRIGQVIAATPPGYRERHADLGVQDATPILIVGMPRSGSTLTEQILSSHPDIRAGGELQFWQAFDKEVDPLRLTATSEATRHIADDYLAVLRAHGSDAKRVTDKLLDNFVRLGLIHRIFPNATIIHCRRHPIDNALSMFTTKLVEADAAYISNRSDLVFAYRQYQRLMAHWREVLPSDRFVEVDYEALVADPEPQARRLISACGVGWNDACLAPHQNRRRIETASLWQARQPIYRTSVERWRRYEPWLGELRELATEG